jgi:hypothetical protein
MSRTSESHAKDKGHEARGGPDRGLLPSGGRARARDTGYPQSIARSLPVTGQAGRLGGPEKVLAETHASYHITETTTRSFMTRFRRDDLFRPLKRAMDPGFRAGGAVEFGGAYSVRAATGDVPWLDPCGVGGCSGARGNRRSPAATRHGHTVERVGGSCSAVAVIDEPPPTRCAIAPSDAPPAWSIIRKVSWCGRAVRLRVPTPVTCRDTRLHALRHRLWVQWSVRDLPP